MPIVGEWPFVLRLGVLLGILAVIALVEVLRRGRAAERPRELAFLLAAGAVGALYGLGHDAITVGLSPEYFVVGKGLEDGAGLAARARRLGAEAGASGGIVGGAILLLAGRAGRRRPKAPYRELARGALLCLLAAATAALLAALLRPLDRLGATFPGVPAESLPAFRHVWGIHLGSYVGLAAGLLLAVRRARAARRRSISRSV